MNDRGRIGSKNMFNQIVGEYIVYWSYDTPIAVYHQPTNQLYENSQKYSRTTTRHMSEVYNLTGYPKQHVEMDERSFFSWVRELGIELRYNVGDTNAYQFGEKVEA